MEALQRTVEMRRVGAVLAIFDAALVPDGRPPFPPLCERVMILIPVRGVTSVSD